MKILFHYHTPAIQKGSGIYMPAYLGLFIDSIAKYYEEIILLLHLPNKKQKEITTYIHIYCCCFYVYLYSYRYNYIKHMCTYVYKNKY